jgi:hypothetical protein
MVVAYDYKRGEKRAHCIAARVFDERKAAG